MAQGEASRKCGTLPRPSQALFHGPQWAIIRGDRALTTSDGCACHICQLRLQLQHELLAIATLLNPPRFGHQQHDVGNMGCTWRRKVPRVLAAPKTFTQPADAKQRHNSHQTTRCRNDAAADWLCCFLARLWARLHGRFKRTSLDSQRKRGCLKQVVRSHAKFARTGARRIIRDALASTCGGGRLPGAPLEQFCCRVPW